THLLVERVQRRDQLLVRLFRVVHAPSRSGGGQASLTGSNHPEHTFDCQDEMNPNPISAPLEVMFTRTLRGRPAVAICVHSPFATTVVDRRWPRDSYAPCTCCRPPSRMTASHGRACGAMAIDQPNCPWNR